MNSNRSIVYAVSTLSVFLTVYLANSYGWRQGALFLVGLSAGVILYHAAFGFTAAWREVVVSGQGAGLRAQMVMLGITVIVFTPLIAQGEIAGLGLRGSVAPLSSAILFGAFLFGVGMQLGGGCASGTLFTVGGGSPRMVITLLAFIAGSVLGTWHWSLWQAAPSFPPIALSQQFNSSLAIVISITLFAAVWLAAARHEKRRTGQIKSYWKTDKQQSWVQGPWPLIAGAIALAGVNVATLLLAGRPWGVTSGFALWGAKIAQNLGIDVSAWAYWQRPGSLAALENNVLNDITSVMNFGIVLGALIAAGMAMKFSPKFQLSSRSLLAAVLGGLMLGYGARIAYGCNIGAYFGGISSTSLHGWLWFVAAFAGSAWATRLRPWFGLS